MILPLTCVLFALQPEPLSLDLAGDSARRVVVDREKGQYLGHVSTILLDDTTILAAYPKGHGKGPIILKKSTDGGLTWSERLPTPENWSTSLETPTLFRLTSPVDHASRLVLFSSLYPMRTAISADNGASWTPLAKVGDWGGIVGMGDVITRADGVATAFFHDDGRFFTDPGKKSPAFTLYATDSPDGGLTWNQPRVLHTAADVHLCEPGAVRSPDGSELILLLRENKRVSESHFMRSRDEGRTFEPPAPLAAALTGDRHTARYAKDGRLVVCFRDMAKDSPTKGDWVAWVGRYEDLAAGKGGQYRVRLADNQNTWDCGYGGVEVMPDGTIVTTTYGHWDVGESPYIVSVRFTLPELDALAAAHSTPFAKFRSWLDLPRDSRPPLAAQPWAAEPISAFYAESAAALMMFDRSDFVRETRANEWGQKQIVIGDLTMKFDYREFGDTPADGRSLYISMHGGGSTTPQVNDQQWRNQIGLYKPAEGIYLSPRAPNDAWNMWHQGHIEAFFDRIIEDAVVFAGVNPDRVYLMGYSAGGDGVYQLAPRSADRYAAAAMMAGHPNETRAEGLRNLPFTLHMGGNDGAFNRNAIARDWAKRLAELRAADPDGYEHEVTVHEGMGHWMQLKDSVAVPWMASHTRRLYPKRVVWLQDDATQARFYWLEMPEADRKAGALAVASYEGNTITIDPATTVGTLGIWLSDDMMDLSKDIIVKRPDGSEQVFQAKRTLATIATGLEQRPDMRRWFAARIEVQVRPGG